MFSPQDLERVAGEAVTELHRLAAQRDELASANAALASRAQAAESERERLANDVAQKVAAIGALQEEVIRLTAELGSRPAPPPPPPPPPPIEVSPDIEIRLHGLGSFRPPLRGERQGAEVRYRGALNSEVNVIVDCKDDGQVGVVFERCWADLPQTAPPIESNGTIRVGASSESMPISLYRSSRPRHITNPSPPPKFDLAGLIRANLIPNHSGAIRPSETELVKIAQGRYPWERHSGGTSFTETYGQITNSWVGGAGSLLNEASHLMPIQLVYLLTGDPRAWTEIVRLANSSGNYAVHFKLRDEHGGRFPAPSETGALPFLQTEESVTLRSAAGVKFPVPDVAHQHSLTYLAYLLTGERYYREELQAWTVFNLLTRPKNADRLQGIIFSGQVRSAAWALRALLHAYNAFGVTTPGPTIPQEQASLATQINNNLRWMNSRFANPGSTDHRQTGIVAVNAFRPADLLSYVTDEPKPPWCATWNHHVLASVVNECRRAGFQEAVPILKHVLQVIEGVWRHSQSKFDIPWGNHAVPADNWPAIIGSTFRGRPKPPASFQESGSKIAGDYLAWARSAVVAGVDVGLEWAPECLRWTDTEAARWKGIPLAWQISPNA